jgi:hypothetical protein
MFFLLLLHTSFSMFLNNAFMPVITCGSQLMTLVWLLACQAPRECPVHIPASASLVPAVIAGGGMYLSSTFSSSVHCLRGFQLQPLWQVSFPPSSVPGPLCSSEGAAMSFLIPAPLTSIVRVGGGAPFDVWLPLLFPFCPVNGCPSW